MYSLTTDHESHSQPAAVYTTSPVIIAFTLGILICFVVGFCFVYLCRCCFMNALYSWALQHPTSGTLVHRLNSPSATTSPYRGLDPSLLQIFPTFPYASVKDFHSKNKNHSLECAICLLEFEDDSFLRLLTVCCHVFHQECIDLWLGSHKTCPVCRTDLDSPVEKSQENQIISAETSLTTENNDNGNDNNIGVETRIDVKEDDDDGEDEQVSTSLQVGGEGENERFSRSHSTGHSIVVMRGEDGGGRHNQKNDENYTLRLPEHIQVKLIRGGGGGHNYAKSSVTYREMATLCSKCCYAEAISGCSSYEIVRV